MLSIGLVVYFLLLFEAFNEKVKSVLWISFFRQHIAKPLIVLTTSFAFVYLESQSFYIFSVLLFPFYLYCLSEKALGFGALGNWKLVAATLSLLAIIDSPLHILILFTILVPIFARTPRGTIGKLIIGIFLSFLMFKGDVLLVLFEAYSSLLLIPLVFLLSFENEKNPIFQICWVISIVLITSFSPELYENFYLALGSVLLLISTFRRISEATRGLVLSTGLYLGFLSDQSSIILIPVIFITTEMLYFKKLLLDEMRKVVIDSEHFSIGYNQVASFALLFFLFSGLPYTPYSFLFSLGSFSVYFIIYLLLIDFPQMTFEALLEIQEVDSFKNNVIRFFVLVAAITPLSINLEIRSFYFQIIALALTLITYFYLRKNKELCLRVTTYHMKSKLSYSMLPFEKEGNSIKGLPKETFSVKYKPFFVGFSPTIVFGLYFFVAILIVLLVSR